MVLCIDISDENLARWQKSPMLDHAYKFHIRQYDVLRINEDHVIKENQSVPVVEELTTKETIREWKRMQNNYDETNKWREARDDKNATEKLETKYRSDTDIKGQLVYSQRGKKYDTPPDAVAALSVLFILYGKPWANQSKTSPRFLYERKYSHTTACL